MKFLTFLFSIPLFGASLFVDLGPPDPYCTGGARYDIATPGATGDLTLLYGTFSCKIPQSPGAYLVTLNLRETGTVTAKGQRIFSVKINDQLVLDRFDLFAAAGLTPIAKSYVAGSSGIIITIDFSYSLKSAVASSIEIAPLSGDSIVLPVDGLPFRVLSEVPVQQPDGSWALKGPQAGFSYIIYDVAVYVNGLRMQADVDYKTAPDSGPDWQLKITPTNPWAGKVLADYTVYLPKPLPPVLPSE